jgi:hypothetical protein
MILDLVEIARKEIGIQEDPKHQNTGSSIKKYQDADNLPGQGYPWCASFVDWCIAEYDKIHPLGFPLPKSAAAFDLIKWGANNGLLMLVSHPLPGDIVVYTFSHCGIVSSVEDRGFRAIEGNTNASGGRDGYEVAQRLRQYGLVMKFIRLPETKESIQ